MYSLMRLDLTIPSSSKYPLIIALGHFYYTTDMTNFHCTFLLYHAYRKYFQMTSSFFRFFQMNPDYSAYGKNCAYVLEIDPLVLSPHASTLRSIRLEYISLGVAFRAPKRQG